jgi:hypothetical protein
MLGRAQAFKQFSRLRSLDLLIGLTMLKQNTVFIVGAGASAELGLPTGPQLAERIRAKMDIRFERGYSAVGTGDHDLFTHLAQVYRQHADQLQKAAWRIRDGINLIAQSIDDFLDQHRGDNFVNIYGKAAIVQAVAEAEAGSKLVFNAMKGETTFDDRKLGDTWIIRFMRMLCRGLPREDVHQVFDRVSFIVFNYDRCIEHFLVHALRRGYSLTDQEAAAIVDGLDIVHPYGSIGNLKQVPFGNTRVNCASLAERIKTYTEQADSELSFTLSEMLERAKHIVFLGFAYYDQNLALLAPREDLGENKRVFGTAYGMSDSDVDIVVQEIQRWFFTDGGPYPPKRVSIENNLKCAGLFDNYAKSLTT